MRGRRARHDQELRRGGRAGEARPGRVLRRLWAAGSTSASRCSLFVSAKRSPVTVFAYRKELALFEISFRSRDEPGAQLPFWIFCSLGQPQQGWRIFDARGSTVGRPITAYRTGIQADIDQFVLAVIAAGSAGPEEERPQRTGSLEPFAGECRVPTYRSIAAFATSIDL